MARFRPKSCCTFHSPPGKSWEPPGRGSWWHWTPRDGGSGLCCSNLGSSGTLSRISWPDFGKNPAVRSTRRKSGRASGKKDAVWQSMCVQESTGSLFRRPVPSDWFLQISDLGPAKLRPELCKSTTLVLQNCDLSCANQRLMAYSGRMNQLLTRHVSEVAHDILSYMPGLIIEGARQAGKSTLADCLAQSHPGAVTANLDDQPIRDAARDDPAGFVAQAGSGLLVVDEVQHLPELTLAIKTAIDHDRRPGRFVLTGSSSLWRLQGLADSLAGRVGRLHLFGFSQGELTEKLDDFASVIAGAPEQQIVSFTSSLQRDDYARLVAQGAYPPTVGLTERQRARWFDDYLQGLIRRDLPELRRQVDPARAESLLRLLAANQAGELVKARLANESGIPASSVDDYLDLLGDLWLYATLPPWTPNLTQREIGRRKAFVVDSGLTTRLSRLTAEHLSSYSYGKAFGSLLEGFVAAELLRQRTWSATSFDLFHYRNRTDLEIDLIIELGGGFVIALEVKAATSFQANQFKHLKVLRDRLGDRLIAGIVLNTGQTGYRFSERLYGLPLSALWSL